MCHIQFRINRDRERREDEKQVEAEEQATQVEGEYDNEATTLEDEPDKDAFISLLSPGSKKPINSQTIEDKGGFYDGFLKQAAFANFGSKLAQFIHRRQVALSESATEEISVMRPFDVKARILPLFPIISDRQQIQPYRRMDILYFSMDNGIENRDIIRCHPSFHRRLRFDTVLVQTTNGYQPARLHLLFEANAYKKAWKIALVTYFTRIPPSDMDKIIGMNRYQEGTEGELIFLGSIIRSCYLTPIFSTPGYFYLNNLAAGCTDLYLRCALTDVN
jgi:hypothetical protein